jgi:6-phosphogluconolactonase
MSTIPLYIGTTAQDENSGILRLDFDAISGSAGSVDLAAPQQGASFLARSKDGKFLYSIVDKMPHRGEKATGLAAFAIEADGNLTQMNEVVADAGLCHISLDSTGKWLLGAAYTAGTFSIWPILENGSIGTVHQTIQHEGSSADSRRQTAPHAHQTITTLDNKQIAVADLGTDKVMIYPFDDATGMIDKDAATFAQLAPGAGPRHIVFHPCGAMFVVNELDNTVTVFHKDSEKYEPVQVISTLPEGYSDGTWTAEILLSQDAKYLYATNRGQDSVAVFEVDDNCQLILQDIVASGPFPQHLTFSPDGKWLLCANMKGASMTVYNVDESTGAIIEASVVDLPGNPMCLVFGKE